MGLINDGKMNTKYIVNLYVILTEELTIRPRPVQVMISVLNKMTSTLYRLYINSDLSVIKPRLIS